MDSLELDFLRYAQLQPLHCITLSTGRSYEARLETAPSAIAPQYGLYFSSGERLGSHVLPSGLPDVELYLIGVFTTIDANRHSQLIGGL